MGSTKPHGRQVTRPATRTTESAKPAVALNQEVYEHVSKDAKSLWQMALFAFAVAAGAFVLRQQGATERTMALLDRLMQAAQRRWAA